jgi:hydrogenase-4 component E
MNSLSDTAMILMILSDLALLGMGVLGMHIRIIAVQGWVLGAFTLLVQHAHLTPRVAAIALVSVAVKGALYPYLLRRSVQESEAVRESKPYVGYNTSVTAGLVMVIISLWLGVRLPFAAAVDTPLVVASSLVTMFTGLALAVTRRKALTQCIGYIVFENGIYIFGMAIVGEIPMLVELGLLLDAFVAVLVMGVAIYRINRHFDHMDADELRSLRG